MSQALNRQRQTTQPERSTETDRAAASSVPSRKTGKIAQGWQQTLVHLPPEIKLAAKKRVLEEGTDLSVVIANLLEKWLRT
jgi:hypothetical protein